MNLHSLPRGVMGPVWVWLNGHGQNGPPGGVAHLWEVEPSSRPLEDPNEHHPTWPRGWPSWLPSHLTWNPFTNPIHALGNTGVWVRPLCGARSRARWPRYNEWSPSSWGLQRCVDCTRIATERGIIYGTAAEMTQRNPEYIQMQSEIEPWRQAHPDR